MDRRHDLRDALDELYADYGGSDLAREVSGADRETAGGAEPRAEDGRARVPAKGSGGVVGRLVQELDRSHFEESCLAIGRGERPFVLSERLEAFLSDADHSRDCRDAARDPVGRRGARARGPGPQVSGAARRDGRATLLGRLGLDRPELRAWALYDVANSAAVTSVLTAILPIYFARVAAAELPPAVATQRFALATTVGLAVVAVLAPVLGTLADVRPVKKRMLARVRARRRGRHRGARSRSARATGSSPRRSSSSSTSA